MTLAFECLHPGVVGEDLYSGGATGTEQDQWNQYARHETPLERRDRNFAELLQELRVAQIGIQILLAFLLAVAFQPRFTELTDGQVTLYAVTVFACASSMALIVTPVAAHRMAFGKRMKPAVVQLAHWATLLGLVLMLVAFTCAVSLVAWFALADGPARVLAAAVGTVLLVCWIVIPAGMIFVNRRNGSSDEDSS